MNQVSSIPFGTDATLLSGYAYRGGDRLGNFDLTIENTGANSLYFQLKEQTNPSGAFVAVGAAQTLVPKGVKTVSYNILSQRLGFFGSGNTTANVSFSMRNKGNLRGAQVDIVVTGRRGWGFDPGFNQNSEVPNWGNPNNLI
jgi:hypothetical protein